MKAKPCPECKSTDLNIGNCGYGSFDVAWVRCKECKLDLTEQYSSSAVLMWNKWVDNPVETLLEGIFEAAKEHRRRRQRPEEDDFISMEEYAATQVETIIKEEMATLKDKAELLASKAKFADFVMRKCESERREHKGPLHLRVPTLPLTVIQEFERWMDDLGIRE